MLNIINTIFVYGVLIINVTLFSQEDFSDAVVYTLELNRSSLRAGEVATLTADLRIKKNFYVYSTHPEKSLSPSEIEWEDSSYFDAVGIFQEPMPKIKYDPNFNMDIGYHTGSVSFKQDIQFNVDLKPGDYTVNGTFIYQACDPRRCIPHWDEFSIIFTVESGQPQPGFIAEVTTEYISKDASPDIVGSSVEELDKVIEQGLFSFILFAIGMGFLALLTPCVFPMIPITVSYFTKEGEKEDSSPIFSASVYTVGIIIIFTCLGLILALSLGAAGANQLASNPWVNLFIAALFIYFAFSLFGHYEIQIPSVLRQFSSQQEQKGGVIGVLFMALTFTLTSFTCTVQFVGLLLVAASQGEYFWPAIGMIAFSTAFASPFFFLALFPQYLAKLPKSGGWLNSVKVTMGFLELGAAMKFLSNSDLVWRWGIFTKQAVLAVWIILSIMTGIYLIGKIKLPHDSDINYIGAPRLVLSILFMSFGLYLTGGLFGQPLHGLIDSYLPPVLHVSKENILNPKGEEHLAWINDFSEGMEKAKIENKPLFIDFTGYTCTNCRWMETNVFVDPEVQALFNEFILVQLYTDGGPNHRENQQMEINRFGTAALPFYVVLSPEDAELGSFPGMDPDVSKFITFLEESLANFKNNLVQS